MALRFSLTGGEGVGRYIGLNAINGAVADSNGDLEAIPVLGGLVAWRGQSRKTLLRNADELVYRPSVKGRIASAPTQTSWLDRRPDAGSLRRIAAVSLPHL